jgi:alpha-D-ribose 1-methylphosphonate 5-triphosphate synthase subunit PhnG
VSSGYANQSSYLSTLTHAPAEAVKLFAEELIPLLEPIAVLQNRSGLVMLPMEETTRGELFYLGEVLVAEAHVRAAGHEGYAACLGRDLEQALAVALIDAAYSAAIERPRIDAFVVAQAAALAEADKALMAQVEATRIDLETF